MSLRVFAPNAALARYVTAIWDYEDLTGSDNSALSILPDTATYLCFLYQDPLRTTHKNGVYTTRSGLAGFQSFRSDLGGAGKISGVSARLAPWGLNVFRGGVASDCAESRVDCRDIFPWHEIEKIEDRLAIMNTAKERVECVESYLLSIMNRNNEDVLMQRACAALNALKGNCSISLLARNLGLTERTFERRFLSCVGAKPKKYARVVRLRNAIIQREHLPSWADVAYAAGYYDQSHMIRDFQDLYGISPETLHPQIMASQTIRFSGLLNLYQDI
ncbi:helix-turn-helix transcriptional regulator [Methylocapsa palsarum]|uniref:AraC-type DNA-binding protein n=1 Tax=Methylocapsa palsarum TaxID=1612308 RepID=A0A1I4BF02_9HYPH|nr:helix-turn-helix transcriptional regulator [Methylocapsa palsarum]SFK66870.1 AraC-type DNA-binding protein [Methylocapsa palsarum]